MLRSAFSALPWPLLAEPLTDDLAALIEARIELTAYLCELVLSTVARPSPMAVSC